MRQPWAGWALGLELECALESFLALGTLPPPSSPEFSGLSTHLDHETLS